MAKTVKELKEKMINAVDEIDLSKLSCYELSMLATAVKSIGEIKDLEKNDFASSFGYCCDTSFATPTLKKLKERE